LICWGLALEPGVNPLASIERARESTSLTLVTSRAASAQGKAIL
jgi:hypothetical protein